VTAVLDATPTTQADDSSASARPASWLARVGAFALDVLLGIGVVAVLALLALTVAQRGWMWWSYTVAAAVIVVAMALNRWLLPSITGWSLGRALFGIAVVRRDGAAVGAWRLLVRDLAHLFDTALLFVGWLWPLWDSRRRTFADLLLRTEVRRVEPPERNMRRPTAMVLAAAVVVCAAAVGLNYLVVYRHERAVDEARQQVADQGPRIVEQMLTYGKDTLNDDFARAQSLATDGYREQLVAQQQAVQKADATTNEYFAVSSAVLPPPPGQESPDRASMLLAMQGQRGTNPEELRFITATVRAEFEKSGDGKWRVANLTVLKKPSVNEAPK
jgi:Mce-associated membrane protein